MSLYEIILAKVKLRRDLLSRCFDVRRVNLSTTPMTSISACETKDIERIALRPALDS